MQSIDGVRVPSTFMYRKDMALQVNRPRPMMLYAYGAYGDAVGPTFYAMNFALVDRGIVYGGELSISLSLTIYLLLSLASFSITHGTYGCVWQR